MSRPAFLSSAFRRLPPVARRDQRIADLQASLAASHEEQASLPSFQTRLYAEERVREHERELSSPSNSVFSRGKFWVYDFVRSHGVAVPEQLGRWDDPADIPFADLPSSVVIKSAFGSTSHGVLPLRRLGKGWQLVTHDEAVTNKQLVSDLRDRVAQGRIKGPFGAEEFLGGGERGALPTETKVYAFYGEVQLMLVARSHEHGKLGAIRYRVIDIYGSDLIDSETHSALAVTTGREVDSGLAEVDPTIPTPDHLDDLVDAASRLSVAMRLPFARIDMYGLHDRVVFGEVTPRPGGQQWLGVELDVRLGEAWERAQARLSRDVAAGAPREPQEGTLG